MIRRTLLALAILSAPAWGQAPGPTPTPAPATPTARVVISSRTAFPSGGNVFLDATGSVSADPLVFTVAGSPNEPSVPMRSDAQVFYPAMKDGRWVVLVIATNPPGVTPRMVASSVEITVGVVPAAPTTPDFVPATPIQALGAAYGPADVRAMADTYDESASMLAAGAPMADIVKSFSSRWQARRTPAFAAAGSAFAAISPAGSEPAPAARAALASAWKDFAIGLRQGGGK